MILRATFTNAISTGTSTRGPITAAKASPEFIPNTATATAIANSQLFNSGSIELPINADNLADGMYLIVFTSEAGETISKRFIKVDG